jgi:predicted DNA-binding ribbon-helix-helix protein
VKTQVRYRLLRAGGIRRSTLLVLLKRFFWLDMLQVLPYVSLSLGMLLCARQGHEEECMSEN